MWGRRGALPVLPAAHHRAAGCRGSPLRGHRATCQLLRGPAGSVRAPTVRVEAEGRETHAPPNRRALPLPPSREQCLQFWENHHCQLEIRVRLEGGWWGWVLSPSLGRGRGRWSVIGGEGSRGHTGGWRQQRQDPARDLPRMTTSRGGGDLQSREGWPGRVEGYREAIGQV